MKRVFVEIMQEVFFLKKPKKNEVQTVHYTLLFL